MRRRLASETGQSLVVTVLFLVVLVGATALTIDFGAWYRQQRQAQATADAAALAGAQALPMDQSQALSLAESYAAQNGGGIAPGDISFPSSDTIAVNATRTSPSFFARLFSFGTVTVHASAAARSAVPSELFGVAPIAVYKDQAELFGTPGCPCFGQETSIPLGKVGVPGGFTMVDLDKYQAAASGSCPSVSGSGNDGSSVLSQWITTGFDQYLELGCYASDPGAKFSSSEIGSALTGRLGTVLLFPVYSSIAGNGANAYYDIIGWAAFHLDSFAAQGNSGSLTGYFTQVVWDGLQSASGSGQPPDFGVYSVSLVN